MSASQVWTDILQNFSVADLLEEDFELKQVESTATLPETLDILTKNNIQCVPVWNNNAGSYVGLIDILDILSVIIVTSDCKGLVDIASHNTATWDAFWAQENEVIRTFPASELCNTSTRNPWIPIDISTPLVDVLAMFGRGVGLKRVPVIDGDGFMRGFVTQSGITKWLHNSLDLLNAEVLSKKISDCAHLGSIDVKTVASDSITLDAFKTIVTQKFSALAVVNSAGALIGCISGSDLKGSEGLNLFKDLSKPVSEYLMISTEKFKRDNALHPISVQEDATVGDILKHIAAHKVHRVFVVDKDTKPTKVISLTDLLEFFRNEH